MKGVYMPQFKRKPIEGLFPLMPLCVKENQDIDYDAFEQNIVWLDEKGFPGFIVFGCMGQMNAPSEEEFNKICDVCVKATKGRKIAAVISSTSTNTKEAIRRATYAEASGADGSMLAPTYPFHLDEPWILEFYSMVDDALKGELAIIVYDCPPVFNFSLTLDHWQNHLLKLKSIKAVKESNYQLHWHQALVAGLADKINVFPGSELPFWTDSMLGAKGMIGQFAWIAPKAMLRYYDECKAGNQFGEWTMKFFKTLAQVDNLTRRWAQPKDMMAYEHGFMNALAELGGCKVGPPRKPSGRLPEENLRRLKEAVQPLVEIEKQL